MTLAILVTHCVATLLMVGIIWFVQVVHYPLFDRVGAAAFDAYETRHVEATGYVVGPPMLIEAATALWLAVSAPAGLPAALAWTGLALLAVIWISTALLQVPEHDRLRAGFEPDAHRRLVRSNWLRTVGWSLRGGLAIALLLFGVA
jgi:hypothetical protein